MADSRPGVSGLGVELRHCSLVLGRRRVVADVTLTIAPGDKCLLQGPNGAGKTQLVKLLAGLALVVVRNRKVCREMLRNDGVVPSRVSRCRAAVPGALDCAVTRE